MKDEEGRLLGCFRELPAQHKTTLIEFAEFLRARAGAAAGSGAVPARPRRIKAAQGETVVMAVRRLRRSYPMLDRRKLIHETSRCMAEHALEGRPAAEVIAELETVFARHYSRINSDE
jgi:hypothetical protein